MDWAGNYPNVPNMEMLRHQPDYHRTMMAKWGVPVRLNTEATPELIAAENPDVVVVATGAEPIVPPVQGLDGARASGFALTIDQVLDRAAPRKPGKSVVIWGAGEGAELAIELVRSGHTVRLLDANPGYVPANYVGSRAMVVAGLLAYSGVAIETGYDLASVRDGEIGFRKSDGGAETVSADTLIVCQGRQPANGLVKALTGKAFTLHVLGDARKPRSYANAIHEAAYLARQI
jgi:2,4-dienoyl-CoA reductase (NADPH2)